MALKAPIMLVPDPRFRSNIPHEEARPRPTKCTNCGAPWEHVCSYCGRGKEVEPPRDALRKYALIPSLSAAFGFSEVYEPLGYYHSKLK